MTLQVKNIDDMKFKKTNPPVCQAMNPRAAVGYHPTLVIQQNRVAHAYGPVVVCAVVKKSNLNSNKPEGTALTTSLLKVFKTPNPSIKNQKKKKAQLIPLTTKDSNPK